jgi:hypothetical protein
LHAADEHGKVDWRQVSGLDEHGGYHAEIATEECLSIARETKEFEVAFLNQEIAFLEFMQDYFARLGLRHAQKVYDMTMRLNSKGEPITVMVYYDGNLEETTCRKERGEL